MTGVLRRRFASGSEAGLTLVEMLVAASMSVLLVGAVGSMVISSVRNQPRISEQAQNVSAARWAMERMTREIRNGVRVEDEATAAHVSFVTKVRRAECGGSGSLEGDQPARECQVTYDCATPAPDGFSCTRTEAEKSDLVGGTETTIFSGIGSSEVFNYSPSIEDPTYIGLTLRIPNPSGPGSLTVSDGASLRTPTLLAG